MNDCYALTGVPPGDLLVLPAVEKLTRITAKGERQECLRIPAGLLVGHVHVPEGEQT